MRPMNFFFRGLSLIVLVCWLGVHDAIPLGPYADEKATSPISWQSKAMKSTEKTLPLDEQQDSVNGARGWLTDPSRKSHDTENTNYSVNRNVNANELDPVIIRPESKQPKSVLKKLRENDISDNRDSTNNNGDESNSRTDNLNRFHAESDVTKNLKNMKSKIEIPEKCPIDGRRSNQAYSRSFPLNASSIDLADAFKVTGEAEAKKTSSIHIGEDITLCWIETTTLKEDPTFDPPKRLVIREFTISFENSATIPENYLDCTKLEGEIAPGDEESVCKTSLHEVIDENTKKSRVVNFTSNSRVGPIVVRQQKTVRCAMGSVVFKDIYEWPNGSKNPKKRVEIKVGPAIRNVGVGTDTEPGECMNKAFVQEYEEDRDSSSVSDCPLGASCEERVTCEDGEECDEPNTASPCTDQNCATSNLAEKTLPTIYPPGTDELSTNEVRKVTTTMRPPESSASEILTKSLSPASHEVGNDPCPENDTDCRKITIEPDKNEIEGCSDGDCTGESYGGSISEASGDESEETSSRCTGDYCASKEESVTAGSEAITTENAARPEVITTENAAGPEAIPTENKSSPMTTGINLIDETTAPSFSETDKITLNDSECNSESGECSGSSKISSHKEEIAIIAASATNDSKIVEHSSEDAKVEKADVESATDRHGETEISDEIRSTEVRGSSEVFSTTATAAPCHDSGSEDCTTVVPTDSGLSVELPTEMKEYHSATEQTGPSFTIKGNSMIFGTEPSTDEQSSSCKEDSASEDCQSTGSSKESKLKDDHVTFDHNHVTFDPSTKISDSKSTYLSAAKEYEQNTNYGHGTLTPVPTEGADSETSMIDTSTGLPESIKNVTPLDDESSGGKNSVTKCISNPTEGSGDCEEKQTDVASSEAEETTISLESCESSGSCKSMEKILTSSETNQSTLINSTATINNSGEKICENSTESCENALSVNSYEICEDSSSDDCMTNDSTSETCDPVTGSCSPEASSSIALTDATTIAMTESATKESEHYSTTVDNILITAETQPSTTSTLSQTSPSTKIRHKLALRIKVLLEHINEKKEKERLVQVEKHLLLNERPDEHGNHSLIWQIKSLNNSMNMETFKSILNCTDLENWTEEFSNLTEFKNKIEDIMSLRKKSVDTSVEQSTTKAENETQDISLEGSSEGTSRKKREIYVPEGNAAKGNNVTDSTKVMVIGESLSGVNEDFHKGLDHVLGRISQELDGPTMHAVTKSAESSSSTILKMLADPADKRVHSSRRKRMSQVGGVMSVEELEHPVNGEEIDRWSNERFVSAADGGRVRSLTEFKIMRDSSENSRRVPSGS